MDQREWEHLGEGPGRLANGVGCLESLGQWLRCQPRTPESPAEHCPWFQRTRHVHGTHKLAPPFLPRPALVARVHLTPSPSKPQGAPGWPEPVLWDTEAPAHSPSLQQLLFLLLYVCAKGHRMAVPLHVNLGIIPGPVLPSPTQTSSISQGPAGSPLES